MCPAALWLGCIDGGECSDSPPFSLERTKNDLRKSLIWVLPCFHSLGFLRLLISFRAFCLGVIGFTSPPIGEALVAGHAKNIYRAFGI
jgi:hypothetical protein